MITALGPVALQLGANRAVAGVKIPHPCGDPALEPEAEHALRLRIVETAFEALTTSLEAPRLFDPALAGTR